MGNSVDTIKVLGSLLGNAVLSKGSSSNVLTKVLGAALGGSQKTQGGGNIADVLGGLLGGSGQQQSSGSGGLLGELLGAQRQQQPQQSPQSGGLGGLLGGLLGGNQRQQQGQSRSGGAGGLGGLGGLLGGLLGGAGQKSRQAPSQAPNSMGNNPMGDILGGLLGGKQKSGGGLGELLGAAITQYTQSQNKQAPATSSQKCEHLPEGFAQSEALDQASLLIRGMINAAKSDGSIDQGEQDKIVGKLGEISKAEADFVRAEFAAELDVDAFAKSIPDGMAQQVYAVSLMAIDLDTDKEAQYLHELAKGTGISQQMSNQIHQQLGAPVLYA